MASTLITTNADALKRAARDISSKTENLSTNQVLNCLSGAIAGPGRNWGFLKSAPAGHYVQPGLSAATAPKSPWLLTIEGHEPLQCATRGEALDAFAILAENAANKIEAERLILSAGRADLEHPDHPKVCIELIETEAETPKARPLFGKPPALPGQPLTPQVLDRLRGYLAQHRNMLIAGAAGVGKTTLLNDLVSGIPDGDKVVCIETHPELHIPLPNVTKFIVEPEYIGQHKFKYRAAFASAVRMNPKWFAVGEIASPAVFTDLVDLAIAGYCFVGTMHAASATDAILRMKRYLQAEMPNRAPEYIKKDISSTQLISVCLHHQTHGQPARIEACTVSLDDDNKKLVFVPIEL